MPVSSFAVAVEVGTKMRTLIAGTDLEVELLRSITGLVSQPKTESVFLGLQQDGSARLHLNHLIFPIFLTTVILTASESEKSSRQLAVTVSSLESKRFTFNRNRTSQCCVVHEQCSIECVDGQPV
jgi:hypothetical protein